MKQSFQLKGSLFTLSVLQLLDADLEHLDQQLAERIKLAPKFFQNAPIVIDVQDPNIKDAIDFNQLAQVLKKHALIPVGVRGGSPTMQQQAQTAGFATMTEPPPPTDNAASPKKVKKPIEQQTAQPIQAAPRALDTSTLLITAPIRSGQQIYSPGDLVIVASVSPGAELLAEGNIHVYGSLRGRALAGINGNSNARIFCHKLEAELISIAGHYRVFEDTSPQDHRGIKQVYLEDGQLLIRPL